MLVKIEPEKVSEGWNLFASLIEEALPEDIPGSEVVMTNILSSIMAEQAHAWVEMSEEKSPRAFIVTTFQEDIVQNRKSLLIYTLTVLEEAERADWKSGLKTLGEFARSEGCGDITFHIQDQQYRRYLEMLGAEFAGTVMVYEV